MPTFTYLFTALFMTTFPLPLVHAIVSSPCDFGCNFRLCRVNGLEGDLGLRPPGTTILLRQPHEATHPYVCMPDADLQEISKTGQARLRPSNSEDSLVDISNFKSSVSRARFSPRYFTLKELTAPVLPGKYGLVRSNSNPMEQMALDDVCVVLPINEYRVGNASGSSTVVKTISPKDCVSYRVRAPKLLISLSWNTSDDFNLAVKEPGPDGFEMAQMNTRSPSGGRLLNDNDDHFCGVALAGREQVRYMQDAELIKGTYSILVTHFKNCRTGPTEWSLSAYLYGSRKLLQKGGFSNEKSIKPILNVTFAI